MIPGPDRVHACPRCGALVRVRGLFSGNTYGLEVWTDGFSVAPMLPRPPTVARCDACKACYWLRDARLLGEVPLRGAPVELRRVPYAALPSVSDLYLALLEGGYRASGGLVRGEHDELELRILAVHAENHALRARGMANAGCTHVLLVTTAFAVVMGSRMSLAGAIAGGILLLIGAGHLLWKRFVRSRQERALAAPGGRFAENLRILFDRLSAEDPSQRLMKAEVARELGRFDEAIRLLSDMDFPAPDDAVRAATIQALATSGDRRVRRVLPQA